MVSTRMTAIFAAGCVLLAGAGGARPAAAAGDQPATWSGALGAGASAAAESPAVGAHLYARGCAVCHGAEGRGDGPGADLLPARPRDFTTAQYRVRSTESGELPTDDDLYRTISVGFPEYGMPRFVHLSPAERRALVAHIKGLSPHFASEESEGPLEIDAVPPATQASIARGRALYAKLQCAQCHGPEGRGDGPSAHIMTDARGYPARTRDFHKGADAFKRGGAAVDLVATLMTGMDGTPMPSYEGVVPHDDLVAVAHFVEALSREP